MALLSIAGGGPFNLEIEIKAHANKLEVALIGDLNETQAIALADRLLNLCPAEIPSQVEINLKNCPHVCSQGIGAMVSFRLSPQISKAVARITGQAAEIERHMLALKLDRLFEFDSFKT